MNAPRDEEAASAAPISGGSASFAARDALASEHHVAAAPRSSMTSIRLSLGDEPLAMTVGGTAKGKNAGAVRRTWGMVLLMVTVFLWTTSNFLASYIFADDTYPKPYFVTYINTSFFAVSLVPIFMNMARRRGYPALRRSFTHFVRDGIHAYSLSARDDPSKCSGGDDEAHVSLLPADDLASSTSSSTTTLSLTPIPALPATARAPTPPPPLKIGETALLSLEFCLLWFTANYFVAACLQHTTVASSTILTSTSSIWTLLFGALGGVEPFSPRKLLGVTASLLGIVLISSVDLSGADNDAARGQFPHKTRAEIAVGDALAFLSAVVYAIYAVVMKKRIGDEERVDMPLFFGLVGLFNVLLLWPGFILLHFTGIETFELPPTGKVWAIVLINSISSLISDFCWAYAMLLTTPLVVTVGLSLTIPLSLVGQILLSAQYSSPTYWVGAGVVLLSFLFINRESRDEARGAA